MITQEPGATGRGANTAWWAGIANLFWYVISIYTYPTLGTLRGVIYLSYQCPLTNFFCSFFFSSRWADREKGVAGMIASQVMPFGDMNVMGQWGACEAAVYQALGN